MGGSGEDGRQGHAMSLAGGTINLLNCKTLPFMDDAFYPRYRNSNKALGLRVGNLGSVP